MAQDKESAPRHARRFSTPDALASASASASSQQTTRTQHTPRAHGVQSPQPAQPLQQIPQMQSFKSARQAATKSSVASVDAKVQLIRTLIILTIALTVIVGAGFSIKHFFFGAPAHTQLAQGQKATITIKAGASAKNVAKQLYDTGLIDSTKNFFAELENQKAQSSIKPGTYEFAGGTPIADIIRQLVQGPNTNNNKLTVPEGLTVEKTAALVEKTLGIPQKDFLAQAKLSNYAGDFAFLKDVPSGTDSLEGFLCPKTYDFSDKKVTADLVIRAMLSQYQKEYSELNFDAARAHIQKTYGVTLTNYQLLTMASIIEREAVTDEDRPLVASVFYNRLKKDMFLQSDATMSYVVKREVTPADLKKDSPYNTYLHKGLTPTPTCAPSIASLKAAFNPTSTDYYYFFIIEKKGYSKHAFSKTLEEHKQAIAEAKAAQPAQR